MLSGGALTDPNDHWIAFYRCATVFLLTCLIGALSYFGELSLSKQSEMANSLADISAKMAVIGVRGDDNRNDISELKTVVRDVQSKVDSLHGAVTAMKAVRK